MVVALLRFISFETDKSIKSWTLKFTKFYPHFLSQQHFLYCINVCVYVYVYVIPHVSLISGCCYCLAYQIKQNDYGG